MPRLLLINPNSTASMTDHMVQAAREIRAFGRPATLS
jgi:Asp/Glu/hydantoin racemase